jgi:hypothetical protein
MTDNNTEQIIFKMNEGFEKLHERFNDIAKETATRQIGCSARFGAIEQQIAVKTAVNGIKDIEKSRKVANQSWLVRTALGSIIVGVLVIIWKIFLGHIDLIIK